jgi:hypothetical protein
MGKSTHAISGVFVFLLLGLFAVFSTVMVLMGAKAYRGMVEESAMHNSLRVASSYIRTMLRSNDESDVLKVEDVDGIHTITMENDWGDIYVTRLYVYDGKLREWFAMAEIPFVPQNGESVCDLDSMHAEIVDGILKVNVVRNEMDMEIDYAPRSLGQARGEE